VLFFVQCIILESLVAVPSHCSLRAMSRSKQMDGDVLLSSRGDRQLAFGLTREPADFQPHLVGKVFCSPLRRALLTALAAYPNHKITVDPRLREVEAQGGLDVKRLKAWLKQVRPDRVEDVDFSRLSSGAWWGSEQPDEVATRLQSFLKDVNKSSARTGLVALVGHSIAIQTMAGLNNSGVHGQSVSRPFPRAWGNRRGWPQNFKPYFAKVSLAGANLHVVPVAPKSARFVLVRHAHSAAQAARTAKKMRLKAAQSLRPPLKHHKAAHSLRPPLKKNVLKRKAAQSFPNLLKACATRTRAQDKFRIIEHGEGTMSLKGADNKQYVSAEKNGLLHCSASEIEGSSKFTMSDHSDGTVSLRSAHGKHVCARKKDGRLMANKSHIKAWEKFTLIKHGRTLISLKSCHGRYVSVDRE